MHNKGVYSPYRKEEIQHALLCARISGRGFGRRCFGLWRHRWCIGWYSPDSVLRISGTSGRIAYCFRNSQGLKQLDKIIQRADLNLVSRKLLLLIEKHAATLSCVAACIVGNKDDRHISCIFSDEGHDLANTL